MSRSYIPDQNLFDSYYTNQAKNSALPFYAGASIQSGHGLGHLFGSLFRTLTPILKGSIVPLVKKGAKSVAKEALAAGAHMAADTLGGSDPVKAMKRHSKRAAKNLVNKGTKKLANMLNEQKKNTRKRKRGGSSVKRHIKRHKDIFD